MDRLPGHVCQGFQGDLSHGRQFSGSPGRVPVQRWSRGTGYTGAGGAGLLLLDWFRGREGGWGGLGGSGHWWGSSLPEGFTAQPGSGAHPGAQSLTRHAGPFKNRVFLFTVRSSGW